MFPLMLEGGCPKERLLEYLQMSYSIADSFRWTLLLYSRKPVKLG